MAEKRGLLARINDEKKKSKMYNDSILLDSEKVYSDAFVLMKEENEDETALYNFGDFGCFVRMRRK